MAKRSLSYVQDSKTERLTIILIFVLLMSAMSKLCNSYTAIVLGRVVFVFIFLISVKILPISLPSENYSPWAIVQTDGHTTTVHTALA